MFKLRHTAALAVILSSSIALFQTSYASASAPPTVEELQAFLDKDVDYEEIDRIESLYEWMSGTGANMTETWSDIEGDSETGTGEISPPVEWTGGSITGTVIEEVPAIMKIVTEKTEVIGTYRVGLKSYPIYSLAKWKYDVMESVGMPDAQKLHYLIINSLECGKDDGFCRSGADSGPFQINQIHRGDFAKSNRLIAEKKAEELYRFQLDWTLSRLESYKKRLCRYGDTNSIFRCMMKVHNGNNRIIGGGGYRFKDYYAEKGMALKWALLRKTEESSNGRTLAVK